MDGDQKFAATVVVAFLAMVSIGPIAEALKQKPRSTTLDVEAGIECELKLGKGDEPDVIKCRLDDGKHNITGVGRE